MQDFEVKRGHGKTLEDGGLKSLMEEEFGDITDDEGVLVASFKALKSIRVELASITEIRVETETDIEASPEDSLAAHQAYNRFMQAATSFNAKQRVDRAKAKAKKEAKAAAEKEMKNTNVEEASATDNLNPDTEERTGEEVEETTTTEDQNSEIEETTRKGDEET